MTNLNILNVGAGDIELSFDQDKPAERIRAARIVKDMLRRGYALLVEVERGGEKRFERALDFDEEHCRYVIADFDPISASKADEQEAIDQDLKREASKRREEEREYGESTTKEDGSKDTAPNTQKGKGRRRKHVDADKTRAVAVARSAGG